MMRNLCPSFFVILALTLGAWAAVTAELPQQVDLRPVFDNWGLGPRKQGARGTCSVFTTTAALEFALAKRHKKGVMLSPEFLNWAANQTAHAKPPGDGQFFKDCLNGFKTHGICSEEEMPYHMVFDPAIKPSSKAVKAAAELRKHDENGLVVHWINPLKEKPGLADRQMHKIRQVLAQGWPVAAGASHSRLLVGYEAASEKLGDGVFLTKDSGKGAYAIVSWQFVQENVGDVFWIEALAP